MSEHRSFCWVHVKVGPHLEINGTEPRKAREMFPFHHGWARSMAPVCREWPHAGRQIQAPTMEAYIYLHDLIKWRCSCSALILQQDILCTLCVGSNGAQIVFQTPYKFFLLQCTTFVFLAWVSHFPSFLLLPFKFSCQAFMSPYYLLFFTFSLYIPEFSFWKRNFYWLLFSRFFLDPSRNPFLL